jgi:hypothetical protein
MISLNILATNKGFLLAKIKNAIPTATQVTFTAASLSYP